MKNFSILCCCVLVFLTASCQRTSHFVGGVVVANSDTIVVTELYSGDSIEIPANTSGQTEFFFHNIKLGDLYEIDFSVQGDQACTISDHRGEYTGFPLFNTKIQCADANGRRYSGNPILRNFYTADPTLIAANGYLYLYAGRDETSLFHLEKERCGNQCLTEFINTFTNFAITGIHIYRTQNLVDWEYVGPAIEAKDVDWMEQTWASHIVEKDSKYYLYTCSPIMSVLVDGAFQTIGNLLNGKGVAIGPTANIGVAVSDSPEGPFQDIGEPILSFKHPDTIRSVMDPAVFIDDDGQAYLFYGGGGEAQYVALADDMISIQGPIKPIFGKDGSNPIPGFTEGIYIHKRHNIYYLSYSKSKFADKPKPLAYATATSIHGPWTYQGDFLDAVGIQTNHGAIVTYQGQDYLFYHTGNLPGIRDNLLGYTSNATRAVSVDELYYSTNGLIYPVIQTDIGVMQLPAD